MTVSCSYYRSTPTLRFRILWYIRPGHNYTGATERLHTGLCWPQKLFAFVVFAAVVAKQCLPMKFHEVFVEMSALCCRAKRIHDLSLNFCFVCCRRC